MGFGEALSQAFMQIFVALAIGALYFILKNLFGSKNAGDHSFLSFMGLRPAVRQLDRGFLALWIAVSLFAVLSTLLEFKMSTNFKHLLTNDQSPYGKILKSGANLRAIGLALIYCFGTSAGAEEILFRGLIARRIFNRFGFRTGNILQALIFWLMHFVIFRLIIGVWFSEIQIVAFITSLGLGLIFGYANLRNEGRSILPSWLLHASTNLMTFLTMFFLWTR